MKISFWPGKQHQENNLVRLKYIFDNKEQALIFTPDYCQEIINDYYDYIIDLYGNLFSAFENPLAARAAWKFHLTKNKNRFLLKQSVNDITLKDIINMSSESDNSTNGNSSESRQIEGFLYNDQNVDNDIVEGKRYKTDGNFGNSSFSNNTTNNSKTTQTNYNLVKIAQLLELNSNAETDLINSLINSITASIQPTTQKWKQPEKWDD